MASAPTITTVTIDQLRLGYPAVRNFRGHEQDQGFVYYLADEQDHDKSTHRRIETAKHSELQERLIRPSNFSAVDFPAEFTALAAEELQASAQPFQHPLIVAAMDSLLNSSSSFLGDKAGRFLKTANATELLKAGIDHRTLRYAAQILHPGTMITLSTKKSRVKQTGRIKAVGFGIAGFPLGILLYSTMAASLSKKKTIKALAANFWYNVQDLQVSVHDEKSPGRTLLAFDGLRSFEAFPNA